MFKKQNVASILVLAVILFVMIWVNSKSSTTIEKFGKVCGRSNKFCFDSDTSDTTCANIMQKCNDYNRISSPRWIKNNHRLRVARQKCVDKMAQQCNEVNNQAGYAINDTTCNSEQSRLLHCQLVNNNERYPNGTERIQKIQECLNAMNTNCPNAPETPEQTSERLKKMLQNEPIATGTGTFVDNYSIMRNRKCFRRKCAIDDAKELCGQDAKCVLEKRNDFLPTCIIKENNLADNDPQIYYDSNTFTDIGKQNQCPEEYTANGWGLEKPW